MDAETLAGLRALVDPTRLRVVARLVATPADAPTLARELRLALPVVTRALDRLATAGLVERRTIEPGLGAAATADDPVANGPGVGDAAQFVAFHARLDRVGALARALAAVDRDDESASAGTWPHDGEPLEATLERLALTADERRTLRAYLVDGRLASIPAQDRKRRIVLRFLLERVFAEPRTYPEKEVNQRLALFHPDVAALRRYLVDLGMVERAAGQYWRRPEPAPGPSGESRLPSASAQD